MTTPSYLSANPNSGNTGWLARLGSYFGGGGTPTYAGDGQPSSVSGGPFRSMSPVYLATATTAADPSTSPTTCPCTSIGEPEDAACPIDPEALAAGQIAIVIPRQGT